MATNIDNLPFSKRYGLEPIDIPFQVDCINDELRTDLWNGFYIFLIKDFQDIRYKDSYRNLYQSIWMSILKKDMDDFPYDPFDTTDSENIEFTNIIKHFIKKETWNKVYELFEFVFNRIRKDHIFKYKHLEQYINNRLRENNSAYTLIGNQFIPITNSFEIDELKQTLMLSKKHELSGIHEHLSAAVALISQKPEPDFRNAIKESISMVEVISRIIEPKENTLGKALTKLDKNQKINQTLKAGFEKLYAYTNGKNGIRHGIMDDQIIDYEEAKFSVLAVSPF